MPVEIKSLDGKVLKTVTGESLYVADLQRANLQRADLQCADLCGADLRDADLRYANLQYADLCGADLRHANLRGADLQCADLCGADLRDADLRYANLLNAILPEFQIPQGVEIIGYKKISTGVITLKIPAEARRTACLVSNKCRAEFAIMIEGKDGESLTDYHRRLEYKLGEKVIASSYDGDIRRYCTMGVHFFMYREDAEEFSF